MYIHEIYIKELSQHRENNYVPNKVKIRLYACTLNFNLEVYIGELFREIGLLIYFVAYFIGKVSHIIGYIPTDFPLHRLKIFVF